MNEPVVSNVENPHVYDVFNGDADGICALQQLRLAYPRESVLVTGVKRDIALLQRVPDDARAHVTVLDISLDTNAQALRRILDAGARVAYFDHHSAQQAFAHPRLQLYLDGAPDVCTSILVDRHLQGRFRKWAITAAFGDNLPVPARMLAATIGMDARSMEALETLGTLLNYNAYGECIEDLHVAPDVLYRAVHAFADPFDFIYASPYYPVLADGYRSDAGRMATRQPYWCSADGAIYILPCAPWARRVSGVFANQLAAQGEGKSFAVLTESTDGSFVVSVRSGQPVLRSANGFCERFPTGGGRKAAAGINALPASELDRFARSFSDYFCAGVPASCGTAHANQQQPA